jgi:hypothetical protein
MESAAMNAPFDPTGRCPWALMTGHRKPEFWQLSRRTLQTAYLLTIWSWNAVIRQVLPEFRGNRRHRQKIE